MRKAVPQQKGQLLGIGSEVKAGLDEPSWEVSPYLGSIDSLGGPSVLEL